MEPFTYYDIHTHQPPTDLSDGVVRCFNRIVGREPLPEEKGSHCLYSCGIHPWYIEAGAEAAQLEQLERMLAHPAVVFVGEAGLDKGIQAPFAVQKDLFEKQACMAERFHKPLLIHCVKAWGELLAWHRRLRPQEAWVVHGFRKGAPLAEQLLHEGFILSFGESFQPAALQKAWEDGRLLLETDEASAPIEAIYEKAATALQVPLYRLAEQISRTLSSVWA